MARVTDTSAVRAAADLWHHYGRGRAGTDRGVPGGFAWTWGQDCGPGAELLGGDLGGLTIGDLGSGSGRHAAHLVVHHRPARVDAVDASPAQCAMAEDLYGSLAPRLRLVRSEAVGHLLGHPGAYDVLYSVFGSLDFTDPAELLPAAASALRPGGLLVAATLGHYLGGAPAEADAVPAEIPARTPEGAAATMRRWVLQPQVWAKALDAAGFTAVSTERVAPAVPGGRSADTLLVRAVRRP